MSEKKIGIFQFGLGYFKQGDDLRQSLEAVSKEQPDAAPEVIQAAAFVRHAEFLEGAAKDLRAMAVHAAAGLVKIKQADTHSISLEIEKELGARLLADETVSQWDDEEEDDDQEEDDDEEVEPKT